jgi:ATP-dependent RNA helicase DeaD
MIERATRQPIGHAGAADHPGGQRRAHRQVQAADHRNPGEGGLEQFQSLIEDFEQEQNVPAIEIAAALAKMARGDVPLLLDKKQQTQWEERPAASFDRPNAATASNAASARSERFRKGTPRAEPACDLPHEVGYQHGVKPGNIVGAIANEGGIDSKNIGRIEIYDDYTVLDMPDTLSREALE